jgi:hypothetical protein
LRVDVIFLASAEETVKHGYIFSGIVIASKEVVFAAYG